MSESDPPLPSKLRGWLALLSDAFGVIGGVVLVLTLIPTIANWLPWPWFLIPFTIGATLFCISVLARVFIVNNEPLQTIGYSQTDTPDREIAGPKLKEPLSTQGLAAKTIDSSPVTEIEIGYLECHAWDEYAGRHVLGATVIAQNEHTGREYRGTTNHDGQLMLSVPCGYYTVTTYSDRHVWRTDAVRVSPVNKRGFLEVSLQLTSSGRWLFNHNARKVAINQLSELSKQGSALLKETQAWNNGDAIKVRIDSWETKAADCVGELFGNAEQTLFLSDSPIEIYEISSATATHRQILNRLNTRIIRLNKLIERVNTDISKSMPWNS